MKKILTCLFAAAFALGCSSDDDKTATPNDPNEIVKLPCASKELIILITQADVDAFKGKGYCSVRKLRIGPEEGVSNITDLTPLEGLLNVEESLQIINNPQLQSLKGLHNVINVGTMLYVADNNMLTGLEGLEGIKTIGTTLSIARNNNLKSLAALKNVKMDADAGIAVISNPKLEVLGLENVTQLYEMYIYYNESLKNLNGLSRLTSVGYFEVEQNNVLESLSGVGALESVYELRLNSNLLLKSIDDIKGATVKTLFIRGTSVFNNLTPLQEVTGLENIYLANNLELSSLEGLNDFTEMTNVTITGNPKLTSISALSKLTTIRATTEDGAESGIEITFNDKLQTLDGLQNVVNFEGFVKVSYNDMLTDFCAIQNIIDNGNYSNYYFDIAGNQYTPDFTVPGGCSMD